MGNRARRIEQIILCHRPVRESSCSTSACKMRSARNLRWALVRGLLLRSLTGAAVTHLFVPGRHVHLIEQRGEGLGVMGGGVVQQVRGQKAAARPFRVMSECRLLRRYGPNRRQRGVQVRRPWAPQECPDTLLRRGPEPDSVALFGVITRRGLNWSVSRAFRRRSMPY